MFPGATSVRCRATFIESPRESAQLDARVTDSSGMQQRIWISLVSFGVVTRVIVGCGEPALDELNRPPPSPEAGGAFAVASGSRAKGGSAGTKATGGRAPTVPAPRGGTAAMNAAAAGEAGDGGEPSAPPSSVTGGRAETATGGRMATGGKPASTGGAAEASGGSESAGGAAEITGGSAASGGSGGASASGGETQVAETGGTSTGGQGTGGSEPAPLSRALWFSEYVEGSSGNRKALEISTLEPTTLRGCRVEIYSNGSATASSKALEGEVFPGAPWVLCTKELVELGAACSAQVALNFNGDDAVALACEDGIIDVIGQIGEPRPGAYWGTAELKTADMTLRRLCSVSAGDPIAGDAFDPSLEWEALSSEALDGLGNHCLE
jgi:hypothetical protein